MIKDIVSTLRNALAGGSTASRQPPETVAQVDLDRLLGTWLEVARLPNLEADGFGRRSVNFSATYAKRPDGRLSVQTVSYNASASMRRTEVKGLVRPASADGSKLVLTFFKLIRGDLWILGLDPEYRWVLTGTPSRRRLWLIARTPRLDPVEYDRAIMIAAA
ncbi:lipocalin family protein [Thiococcus pfennigii]|uniref:lipocalin family protein n=1 Tax=Thiococcus pfennigii TaxID=1057 RepID=UPI001908A2E0|nr:lipocalin family protein [Thiococcus pfennigii]MBK1701506.1 hypothetical protein [Thiococcus pfennigii]